LTDNVHARTFLGVTGIDVIRRAMKDQGITTAELARRTGIHASLIGRYLRGEITIGLRNGPRIATSLGLSASTVLGLVGVA
jgi:transcriptional regulator with XRE-family HTH domain